MLQVHILATYFSKIYFNITLPYKLVSNVMCSIKVSQQEFCIKFPMRATCLAHCILLDLISQEILREEYEL
jgi:hypothetical protein